MKLLETIHGKEGPERLAAIAAWLQSLYDADPPVLVGGAAVELLTEGAYTTGDLDFVGALPPEVARRLSKAGFHRKGRHWLHEGEEIFLEFPSRQLDDGESAGLLEVFGWTVRIIGLEELIVDRLAAWQFWRSTVDAHNAWLLLDGHRRELGRPRLQRLAKRRQVEAALRELLSFDRDHEASRPTRQEIEQWAERIPS